MNAVRLIGNPKPQPGDLVLVSGGRAGKRYSVIKDNRIIGRCEVEIPRPDGSAIALWK